MSAGEFFELDTYHIGLAAAGAVVILAFWLPRFVTRREPSSAGLLVLLGMAAYAFVPGLPEIPDPRDTPLPWEMAAELAVIISLFATGLRIDKVTGLWRWGPTIRLLAITMPLSIVAVAVMGLTMAGMTLGGAVLLGAVLAPTDPVLAADVQVGPPLEGGEHPVRFALTSEAALNDGLAFPFVYLGLLIAVEGLAPSGWAAEWILQDVVWRIGVGAVMGAAGGWALGQVLFRIPRGATLAETASGVVALAGVLLCYGSTELMEGYGFIAVATAGLALRRVEADHRFHRSLHDFTEALEHALSALLLVALGAVLPGLLASLTLVDAAIALLLLLVVRPLAGWVALIGAKISRREIWTTAFFGVRGVGSIYYLAYAAGKVEFLDEHRLWAMVGFAIFVSTIIHGFTAAVAVENLERESTR